MSDAVLTIDSTTGFYDFSLDANGDIDTKDFFDTSILYSLFGERRASADEVVEAPFRRGWIGNDPDFENGSKLWLFEQARVTRENLNRIEDEAIKALSWLVTDGYAVAIDDVIVTISNGAIFLNLTIRRSRDKITREFFILWETTGRA